MNFDEYADQNRFKEIYLEFFSIPESKLERFQSGSINPDFETVEDGLKKHTSGSIHEFLSGRSYIKRRDDRGFDRFWFVVGDVFYGLRIINKGSFYRITFAVTKNILQPIDGKVLVKNPNFPKVFSNIIYVGEHEISNSDSAIISFRPAKSAGESDQRTKTIRGKIYNMALRKAGYKDVYIDNEQYIYFSKSKSSKEIEGILNERV